MKAINSLVVSCRGNKAKQNKQKKKTEDDENVFFKGLAENFFVNVKKLLMADLQTEKGNDMLYYYVITLKVD